MESLPENSASAASNTKPIEKMKRKAELRDFDDLLQIIGPFGWWQQVICLAATLAEFFGASFIFLQAFIGLHMEHYCRVPELDANVAWSDAERRLLSVPPKDVELSPAIGQDYHPCHVYDVDYSLFRNLTFAAAKERMQSILNSSTSMMPATKTCSSGWNFNHTTAQYAGTIQREWELVCGEEHLIPTATSVFMLGFLFGVLLFGSLSDRYGRRSIALISAFMALFFSLTTAFAPTYSVFILLRFLTAAAGSGLATSAFVLCMEIIGREYRAVVGFGAQIPFVFGCMVIALEAYVIRDWRLLILFVTAPSLLCVSYLWLFPESPRWLITQHRYDEAMQIIEQAARWNGRKLPEGLDLSQLNNVELDVSACVVTSAAATAMPESNAAAESLRRLSVCTRQSGSAFLQHRQQQQLTARSASIVNNDAVDDDGRRFSHHQRSSSTQLRRKAPPPRPPPPVDYLQHQQQLHSSSTDAVPTAKNRRKSSNSTNSDRRSLCLMPTSADDADVDVEAGVRDELLSDRALDNIDADSVDAVISNNNVDLNVGPAAPVRPPRRTSSMRNSEAAEPSCRLMPVSDDPSATAAGDNSANNLLAQQQQKQKSLGVVLYEPLDDTDADDDAVVFGGDEKIKSVSADNINMSPSKTSSSPHSKHGIKMTAHHRKSSSTSHSSFNAQMLQLPAPSSLPPPSKPSKPSINFCQLFATPRLRLRTLALLFIWFTNATIYYGLTFLSSQISTNIYSTFFFSGLVELPALGMGYILYRRYGRRMPLCASLVAAGALCMACTTQSSTTVYTSLLTTVLSILGKFFITSSFGMLYIFSSELFPTVVRSQGIALCALAGRLGSAIVPFINETTMTVWASLPLLLFGLLSTLAGLAVLFLPETLNRAIPETLEQAEKFDGTIIAYDVDGRRVSRKNDWPCDNILPVDNVEQGGIVVKAAETAKGTLQSTCSFSSPTEASSSLNMGVQTIPGVAAAAGCLSSSSLPSVLLVSQA